SLAWNQWVRIAWYPALAVWLAAPALLLVVATIYTTARPTPVIAEIAFYLALWQLYPVFAARLTYLSVAIDYPLVDPTLFSLVATIGFHWLQWAKFSQAHPLFAAVQGLIYESCFWQPGLIVLVLALARPRLRNAEFLTTILLAMGLTLIVTTFT